ncbi:MAG: cupin domain-containing protein [Pseudomonadota bacterium]
MKIDLSKIAERIGSGYPEPFRQRSPKRSKKRLGDVAGLTDFGVNLTRLPPGEWSAARHWHKLEDEFVWVLEGELVMVTDEGEQVMRAGDCAGFPKGQPNGHHLLNRSDRDAVYLEVGSRKEGEEAYYPDIDLLFSGGKFLHKDKTPY